MPQLQMVLKSNGWTGTGKGGKRDKDRTAALGAGDLFCYWFPTSSECLAKLAHVTLPASLSFNLTFILAETASLAPE